MVTRGVLTRPATSDAHPVHRHRASTSPWCTWVNDPFEPEETPTRLETAPATACCGDPGTSAPGTAISGIAKVTPPGKTGFKPGQTVKASTPGGDSGGGDPQPLAASGVRGGSGIAGRVGLPRI